MKLLAKIIVTLLLFFANEVKAQYVPVNDANLLAWMNQNIPLALNGNQLDTTSIYVLNTTSISIYGISLTDVSAIQYFDNLESLELRGNNLTNIPKFPNSLTYINVAENLLTGLPSLPSNLSSLVASSNLLTSLPPLNNVLIDLDVMSNQLTSLPSLNYLQRCYVSNNQLSSLPSLPNSLLVLWCDYNQITSLPNLPNSLLHLQCGFNNLSVLPSLPNGLNFLSFIDNNVSELPILPESLGSLDFVGNQISSLPETLPTQLYSLRCDLNPITEIPALPETMIEFGCSYTLITELPPFNNNNVLRYLYVHNINISYLPPLPPNLSGLFAMNNQITCFPTFPQSCEYIYISGNLNTCIPNNSMYLDSISALLPICVENDSINNPNNCTGSSLKGTVFNDLNDDCLEQNEAKLKNVPINIYNENLQYLGTTTTNTSGNFYYPSAVNGYTIKIDTSNFKYITNCTNPGYDTTLSTSSNNQLIDLDFGFKCPDDFDLSIQSIANYGIAFPGQQHSLRLMTGETSEWFGFECFPNLGGTLNIIAEGPIQYIGAPPFAITPTVYGTVYSYNISDFTTIEDNSFELNFIVDTTAQSGDNITVYAEILSTNNEINTSNNSMLFTYEVVNSYDPNLKEVYPQQVLPGFEDYLTYTIHFQNLGSAPAFNIRIADTLSNYLDVETFKVINYSDPNTITINNNILQVRFPNIMLPDSASNPEGSKGFIQYKIKPKSGLVINSTIENTAHIFFDYNPAVVTNTALTECVEKIDSDTIEKEGSFKIFPNPSYGAINISTELKLNGEIKIQLFDLSGKELKISEIEKIIASNWKINLNEKSGFYILQITDPEGNVFKKKIVLN
jgi:uncharacterized repeat protein (TIGR01451 family)